MTKKTSRPNPEKVRQTVTEMREVCRQFDSVNLALDELMAKLELDIRNSTLTAYRLGKKSSAVKSIDTE